MRLGLGGLVVGLIWLAFPQVWAMATAWWARSWTDNSPGGCCWPSWGKGHQHGGHRRVGGLDGIFTPTLFLAAASGHGERAGTPGLARGPLFTRGLSLVGMGGFLAATTHAPLMSILMIFEMTLDYEVVLPLMLACVTAHFTAKAYRDG